MKGKKERIRYENKNQRKKKKEPYTNISTISVNIFFKFLHVGKKRHKNSSISSQTESILRNDNLLIKNKK